MSIRFVLLAAIAGCAGAGGAGVAHAQDPLKSSACTQALAVLDQARPGPADKREAARQAAAQACLGAGSGTSTRPARTAQAPIRVPPPVIEVKPRPPLPPAPALPSPVDIERGPSISSCDATGCWVSDGNRLRHATPNLMAPGGLCALAPGAVGCP